MNDAANAPASQSIDKPYKDAATPTFEFGQNWQEFLESLTDERTETAGQSLLDFLQLTDLEGRSFLDIGCGSGLFSYCAHRLGASRVESFDVDALSVKCCEHMHEREGQPDTWRVSHGSVLDNGFMKELGQFDVVYAWGCLHHTGHMWRAIENAADCLAPGGLFYLAIYNDKRSGLLNSKNWLRIKQLYNRSPGIGKRVMEWIYGASLLLSKLLRFKNPVRYVREYQQKRGMRWSRDLTDWIGGYPYESASVQNLFDFIRAKRPDLYLANLNTAKGLGCHELLFKRQPF